ncbi:MAG: class I SAM-dependent methyltransferase [Actinomycetota bacterium]|nr:class I SAM-dependent methyltransferase [Actinomycetota bacterium]
MTALAPDQARRVYDRIGRAQDWQSFYEDAATRELVAHAAFDDATTVYELGCGTGRFAAGLFGEHLPPAATYLGVDVSPRMIDLASKRLEMWSDRATAELVDGNGTAPVPDASVDRFVSNYVFDLLSPEARRDALDDAHRALAPGGLLCVTGLTPADGGLPSWVSRAWKRVWMRWPVLVGGCRPIRVTDAVDPAAWDVRHRHVVTAWGITSEAVIATPRP